MLWRSLVSFRFGFGLNCGEELRGHHFCSALEHALSHAGYCPSDLNLAAVGDHCYAVLTCEIEITCAFQETRLPFAIDYNSKVLRRPEIFQAHVAGEQPFY